MTAFDKFDQEKKYAERREALDNDFEWTQVRLKKLCVLNEVLFKKQDSQTYIFSGEKK